MAPDKLPIGEHFLVLLQLGELSFDPVQTHQVDDDYEGENDIDAQSRHHGAPDQTIPKPNNEEAIEDELDSSFDALRLFELHCVVRVTACRIEDNWEDEASWQELFVKEPVKHYRT